jgi:predicted transcriptional regulator
MAPKLSLEARMTIIELLRRGWSRMAIAESLGVTEGSVRYHERRRREGSSDGRVGRQQHRLAALAREVEAWLSAEAGRRELSLQKLGSARGTLTWRPSLSSCLL